MHSLARSSPVQMLTYSFANAEWPTPSYQHTEGGKVGREAVCIRTRAPQDRAQHPPFLLNISPIKKNSFIFILIKYSIKQR